MEFFKVLFGFLLLGYIVFAKPISTGTTEDLAKPITTTEGLDKPIVTYPEYKYITGYINLGPIKLNGLHGNYGNSNWKTFVFGAEIFLCAFGFICVVVSSIHVYMIIRWYRRKSRTERCQKKPESQTENDPLITKGTSTAPAVEKEEEKRLQEPRSGR